MSGGRLYDAPLVSLGGARDDGLRRQHPARLANISPLVIVFVSGFITAKIGPSEPCSSSCSSPDLGDPGGGPQRHRREVAIFFLPAFAAGFFPPAFAGSLAHRPAHAAQPGSALARLSRSSSAEVCCPRLLATWTGVQLQSGDHHHRSGCGDRFQRRLLRPSLEGARARLLDGLGTSQACAAVRRGAASPHSLVVD